MCHLMQSGGSIVWSFEEAEGVSCKRTVGGSLSFSSTGGVMQTLQVSKAQSSTNSVGSSHPSLALLAG